MIYLIIIKSLEYGQFSHHIFIHFITTSRHCHTCERCWDVIIIFPRRDLRFYECRTVEGYLKFVQGSEGNERKQRESPRKRETEWRAGALWSCLVWLMWLCLVCCVVSKSTRAWTPPSPWHARWLAMIISPASPPLALSSWGTYSHYSVTPSIPRRARSQESEELNESRNRGTDNWFSETK